ncbi:divalent-cation tolerance protein CutA [Sphingomonas sp. MMS24-J13]|uniref:divalent-cation tolerance protein CutA n=1 Tax=Sphingomonas sp. MMS24-J13 TaxID=3238686 RepID=UPI003850DED8
MTGVVLILCTTGTIGEAEAIARALVDERLAACVQISEIGSWYRWRGEVEHAPEQRLHIKTSADCADRVEARIKALHSYDLPEIVTINIGGSAEYLAWIATNVS